jgi:hypothetical protein
MECSDRCPIRDDAEMCPFFFHREGPEPICLYPEVHAFQMERMECDNPKLRQCPFEQAVQCAKDEPCRGCEVFAEWSCDKEDEG